MVTVTFVDAHALYVRHKQDFLMLSMRCAPIAVMVFVVMAFHAHGAKQVSFQLFLYHTIVFAQLARTSQVQAAVLPAPQIQSRP